jgi:hypothetical protein
MNVITHALLPALLATPVLPRTSMKEFYRAAGIVAIAGALPDLVNPHLSLSARYASWSHSVFALAGFGVLLVLVRWLAPNRLSWKLATLAWFACGLHLFGDSVSGGIAFFHPFSTEIIRPDRRWIPYRWWWRCDGACLLATIIVMIALSVYLDREKKSTAKTHM